MKIECSRELDRCRNCTEASIENLWSCFSCGYIGCQVGGEADDGSDEACPVCETYSGDGFGMAENDPRFKVVR